MLLIKPTDTFRWYPESQRQGNQPSSGCSADHVGVVNDARLSAMLLAEGRFKVMEYRRGIKPFDPAPIQTQNVGRIGLEHPRRRNLVAGLQVALILATL